MALRFISHREIAFRQLLGLLRTPPVAMMSYYTNMFQTAKFVLGDNPENIHFIDKEIRRIECMVGYYKTDESRLIQTKLNELSKERVTLEQKRNQLQSIYALAKEEEQEMVGKEYEENEDKLKEIDIKEHFLYFKLTPLMNLKQIETYMDNNMDLKSYFCEGGYKVYQMQLLGELEKVKNWIYSEAVQIMPTIRFTKME